MMRTVNFSKNQDSHQLYAPISLGKLCSDHKLTCELTSHKLTVKKSGIRAKKSRNLSKLERMKMYSRELQKKQGCFKKATRLEQTLKLRSAPFSGDRHGREGGDGRDNSNPLSNSAPGNVEKFNEIHSEEESVSSKLKKAEGFTNLLESNNNSNFSEQSSVINGYFVDESSNKSFLVDRSHYYFLEKSSMENGESTSNANSNGTKSTSNSSILDVNEIIQNSKKNLNRLDNSSSKTQQKLIAIRTFNDDYENFDTSIEKIVSVDCSGSQRVYIIRVIHNRNDLRDFQSSPSFKQSKFYIVNDSENPVKVRKIVSIQNSEMLPNIIDKNVKSQESFKVTELNSSFESNGTIHLDIVDSPVENMYNVLKHK